MKPIVTWNSTSDRLRYHGDLPKKPQRWRIVIRAKSEVGAAERDIRPSSPCHLNSLVHETVLPLIDETMDEAREATNESLGVTDSEKTHVIDCEFEIYRWR